LVAVLCALAGCGRAGQAPTAIDHSIISFNVSEDPHSLNPILARSDDERQLAHLAFDMLLDVDAHGQPVPALAIAVPTLSNGGVSADGRRITYHLRRGVRWQDGAPFTSRDVRFTWQAVMDPRNAVASIRGYDLIEAIDTPDPLTAIVRLKRPWAPAVETLFTYGAHPIPLLPAHLLEHADRAAWAQFDRAPVGTGPFAPVSWERSTRIIYRANQHYYLGAPRSSEIAAMVIPDFNTDLTMLRAGQLDWSLLSPAQRLALGSEPSLRIAYAPFAGFGALSFNLRRAPFDDIRMRRAIAQSIDRRRLSDAITRGQYPVTDSDQPPFSWAYDPTARLPGYDPPAADRALDALGWKRQADGVRAKDGQRLEIVFAVFPEGDTAVRTAVYVQQMLAARGVDVTIKKVTLAHFYLPASLGGLLMSGKYDVAYFAWRTGEDPDDSDLVTCSGASNYAGYCDAALDALELQALSTPDQSRRRALYSEIQQTLARRIPYLYLYAPTYGYAVENKLRGFEPTPFSPTSNAWHWQR
jgi:peptide/nickel transport system substrate-binding protein